MTNFLIGVTESDIQALPTSGAGWTNTLAKANSTITPSSSSISSQEGNKAFAAGLIYNHKLVSDPSNADTYRNKVITALDTISDPSTGWLTVGSLDHQVANRMVAGWVLAADLISYRSANMLSFADQIRTKTLTGGVYDTMEKNARYWSNNHATLAKASYIACYLYRGEALPSWVIPSVYCLWGDTSKGFGTYAQTTPNQNADGYVVDSAGKTAEETWGLNYTNNGWTPVNHVAGTPTKDGAVIHEVCRETTGTNVNYSVDGGGDPVWGDDYIRSEGGGSGAEYFSTWMQGALVCNVLIEHNGDSAIWSAGSSTFGGTAGCKKAWDYMLAYPSQWVTAGGPWSHPFTVNQWIDSLVKQKYSSLSATGFPTAASGGYGFGFTDWLQIPNAPSGGGGPSARDHPRPTFYYRGG